MGAMIHCESMCQPRVTSLAALRGRVRVEETVARGIKHSTGRASRPRPRRVTSRVVTPRRRGPGRTSWPWRPAGRWGATRAGIVWGCFGGPGLIALTGSMGAVGIDWYFLYIFNRSFQSLPFTGRFQSRANPQRLHKPLSRLFDHAATGPVGSP